MLGGSTRRLRRTFMNLVHPTEYAAQRRLLKTEFFVTCYGSKSFNDCLCKYRCFEVVLNLDQGGQPLLDQLNVSYVVVSPLV